MKETINMDLTKQNRKKISFIIPAFNEEACIRDCINAIRENAPSYSYQIIVVDNGSTDRTSEIVQSERAVLVNQAKGTISSARNKGVRESEGVVLIFLDADVLVTDIWQKEIDKVAAAVFKNALIVTGSRCSVTDNKNWISHYWFARMQYETPNYINSGHLITSRELFDRIGGFRNELYTAEDYDFCVRAKQSGAEIANNPKLYVIHTGYPTTLKDFIDRERWHGFEDFSSLHKTIKSKVALAAVFNVILLIGFSIMAILNINLLHLLIYIVLLYAMSMISSVFKFGFGSITMLLMTSIIFSTYYIGRSLSLIDRLKLVFNTKS